MDTFSGASATSFSFTNSTIPLILKPVYTSFKLLPSVDDFQHFFLGLLGIKYLLLQSQNYL